MRKLKNWPLALQIWLVFASVIVIVFLLLSIYFSISIRSFFTDEIYKTIETAQKNMNSKTFMKEDSNLETVSNDIREVKHIKLNSSNNDANLSKVEKVISNETKAETFLKNIDNQIKNQTSDTKRYAQKVSSSRILYVIKINKESKKTTFTVSYMWDTYRNSLVTSLMKRVFSIMLVALIISLMAAKYLAQKLAIPLRELEDKVKKIGKKQWHEEINIDRADEIGELSKSIEEMRKELIAQDDYEQTMLQQVSHDLKTPLMVVRSYVKAVEDGIYPKGDLQSTMKVIDFEAEKMQKRIKNLLCITKINYMSRHQNEFGKVNIKNIAEEVVDSFIYNDKNVGFQLEIEDIEVKGDEEQWIVVFENIIDNELRYAKSFIKINIYEDTEKQNIIIYNDGEKIPQDKLEDIFGTFKKDKGGNFGLGLDIVKRIITLYGGNIKAENEDEGVSFKIMLDK